MQGLALRDAILRAVGEHQKAHPETPMRQEELARQLGVDADRLEAHFLFLEKSGHLSFLHMGDPQGNRQRFVTITDAGEAYVRTPRSKAGASGIESPFKVVERGEEKLHTEFPALRAYVESTEWVLDEEKPEILQRLQELERVVTADKLDFGALSGLKIFFERHKWLAPHVHAIVKKHTGF